MNVLVIGRGGREHSIIEHVVKNDGVEKVYAAPGNGGICELATCIDIDETDIDGLIQFAQEAQIDLTIVGPENPLNLGIANRFQAENLPIFAPTQEAALLEGSKSFAKQFMQKHRIPTAAYETFTDVEAAKKYIDSGSAPIVIKADGLAEGKGVIIAETKEEAYEAVDQMLIDKSFLDAGNKIVIEEFMEGIEFSYMAFVHGHNVYPMPPAKDHKRAFDHDEGPNTGGMGAYTPVEEITADHLQEINEKIMQKTADGLISEGRPFTGILFAGLMLTKDGPKVIEFNTRFGDPETQVLLPLMENDFVQVILDVLAGKDPQLSWKSHASLGIIIASKGYPGSYKKGVPLPYLKQDDSCFVIQAGTKKTEHGLVSNGGRVLLIGATGKDIKEASDQAYNYAKTFDAFDNFYYRKDIGK